MVDWIHQHDVQHHIHTNDIHNDPDIVGNIILRLNPLRPLIGIHGMQHIYVFVLIGVFGFTVIKYSIENVLRAEHHTPMSKLIDNYRYIDIASFALFIFRWFVFPVIQRPTVWTLLNIAPMFVVGGYYLAFFFLISHNFKGVYMFDKTEPNLDESFLHNQVVTAANVGGAWLAVLNGGLNYQIEHHLFPRIQHSHYAKISPVVRAYCEKKGIPYIHFPTVGDNLQSCVEHLADMGAVKEPVKVVRGGSRKQ